MFPGILAFAALYLTFRSLTEPIGPMRWVIAVSIVVVVAVVSAVFGRPVWRQLGLPGRGPEEFLPVRWLIHRRATARVKRLVEDLARGKTSDPLSAVKLLAVALEKRDLYTRIHSGRVSRLACQIAEHLKRPAWEAEQARMAGLLHDLGKLEIPDSILFKPERLDHREERIMRTHPILSAELIAPFTDAVVVDAVLHHHERIDGDGYPSGVLLCDREFLCRVVPVCDTYDTLISDRPYRPGRAKEEAWTELRAVAGTQLDADLVDALIEVEKEKSRVPAAAAAILPIAPIGRVFRRISHLVHTSTAPAAGAVASFMAAAALAVGPSPPPITIEQGSPAPNHTQPTAVIDDVPPPEVQALAEDSEAGVEESVSSNHGSIPKSVQSIQPAGSSSSQTPPSPAPASPQECKVPVTGTDFPALPPVGCPFSLLPPP